MRDADAAGDDYNEPVYSDPRSPLGLSGASDVLGKAPLMRPDFYNFASALHSGNGNYHSQSTQDSSSHGGHGQESQYSHALSQQGQFQDPFLGQSRASSKGGHMFDFQSEPDDDDDEREQSPSKRAKHA